MVPQARIEDIARRLEQRLTVNRSRRDKRWRTRRAKAIADLTRDDPTRLTKYLGRTFGAAGVDELSDDELDGAFREISTW